ncbi:putative DNA topoisomerase [Helianthus annuus]|nr:putative DNA topoisomerase [Helianthus annuus]
MLYFSLTIFLRFTTLILQMSSRRGSTEVHEFDGTFLGYRVQYKVTSVIGHVFRFSTNVSRLGRYGSSYSFSSSSCQVRIKSKEARGCDDLVLWLDCDREGENICFEVIECTGFKPHDGRRIHRARFSSVTEKDITQAMKNLVQPNKDEALAVDARQEIDLKVGVAFTRFQTTYFQGKYGNLDSRVISYGPCQTPTLGFCVQRYLQISTFKPEKFWVVFPYIIKNGFELKLEWDRNRLFDHDVAEMFQKLITEDGVVKVTGISEKQDSKGRPSGLNTVNLLKVRNGTPYYHLKLLIHIILCMPLVDKHTFHACFCL